MGNHGRCKFLSTPFDHPSCVQTIKKKTDKLPYEALITLTLRIKGISITSDIKVEKMINLEIGKETLKKMMLHLTPMAG